jgi:hypothetical protein
VNALQELLKGTAGPLDLHDVRAATFASVRALEHDRRLREMVDIVELEALCTELSHATCDSRGFQLFTADPRAEAIEEMEQGLHRLDGRRVFFEVLDTSVMADPVARPIMETFERAWLERRSTAVPFRMYLYGRETALLPIDVDNNQAGAYVVSEPELVGSLVELHRRIWQQGSSLTSSAGRRISVHLLQVLDELRSGRSDEAAARHLSVSLRTYRRRVEDLMYALNCQTRFQAGLAAAQMGLHDLAA